MKLQRRRDARQLMMDQERIERGSSDLQDRMRKAQEERKARLKEYKQKVKMNKEKADRIRCCRTDLLDELKEIYGSNSDNKPIWTLRNSGGNATQWLLPLQDDSILQTTLLRRAGICGGNRETGK